MEEDIKQKILEFASLAKECPENLQEKCFEILLSHYLDQLRIEPEKTQELEQVEERSNAKPISDAQTQEDILERDLHVKAKAFLKKYGLTVANVNQIFYKEDGEIKALYDELKTTKSAEGQIRIALLQAFRNAIVSGDFQFDIDYTD